MKHTEIIESFYTAFQNGEKEKMISFYHPEVSFQDPAFGKLIGQQAKNMWSMLVDRGKGQLSIDFSNIVDHGGKVTAHWEARYLFSQTGRQVHNKIDAEFEIENGLIIKHIDRFDFWKWSSMALGAPGILLGWTPWMKKKVRKQCHYLLENYKGS